jgi:hypothetical protein
MNNQKIKTSEGKEALTPEQWWDSQKVMTFEDFESFVESYALLKVAEVVKTYQEQIAEISKSCNSNADKCIQKDKELAEKEKEIEEKLKYFEGIEEGLLMMVECNSNNCMFDTWSDERKKTFDVREGEDFLEWFKRTLGVKGIQRKSELDELKKKASFECSLHDSMGSNYCPHCGVNLKKDTMMSEIRFKSKDLIIIHWNDLELGFGEIRIGWDAVLEKYTLDSEFLSIDTTLRIIKSIRSEEIVSTEKENNEKNNHNTGSSTNSLQS